MPAISPQLQWGRDQLIAEIIINKVFESPTVGLQWGRDQLIAEIQKDVIISILKRWLQWGRDQLIAEIVRCSIAMPCLSSFNGAAIN